MASYVCPTCGEKMERDLSLFMDHTDKHIVEEVKKAHPAWVTPDGYCAKCLEHFKKALHDPDSLETTNIGPKEVVQRVILGVLGFGSAILVYFWLQAKEAPRSALWLLFPLFFAGSLGFSQARKKFCVVIAQKQTAAMRKRAWRIIAVCAAFSALLTFFLIARQGG
jgi:hypothetical protein